MNVKSLALICVFVYIIVSPLLVITAEREGYNKGFSDGYYSDGSISDLIVKEQSPPIESPLKGLRVGDMVKSTSEYDKSIGVDHTINPIIYANFTGVITSVGNPTSNNGLLIVQIEGVDFVVNEYWVEIIDANDNGVQQ
jgi:hypothetical protein